MRSQHDAADLTVKIIYVFLTHFVIHSLFLFVFDLIQPLFHAQSTTKSIAFATA